MDAKQIKDHLTQALNPDYIEVVDDSKKHRHHQGTPHTQNTHFNLTIVSQQFDQVPLIKRHRMIHDLLKDAFSKSLHALHINAKTPTEYSSHSQ